MRRQLPREVQQPSQSSRREQRVLTLRRSQPAVVKRQLQSPFNNEEGFQAMKLERPKSETRRSERGFSLIEVMIAFVVMMVASLAVGSVFFYSVQNNVGGSERALAMGVAQQQLEQLRSVPFGDSSLAAGTTTFPTVSSGQRTFRVVRTVVDEKNANNSLKLLKRITITVTPQSAGGNWIRTPVVLVSFRSSLAQGLWAVQ